MILSDAGKIVSDFFAGIPIFHKRIILDEWVILPNHFHCIITFGDYDFDNGVSDVGGSGGVDKIHEFYLHYANVINAFAKKFQMVTTPIANNFDK